MKINETTSVPLFVVLASVPVVIGSLIGFMLWLTSIDAKAGSALEKATQQEIAEPIYREKQEKIMQEIRDRVIIIDERLKRAIGR